MIKKSLMSKVKNICTDVLHANNVKEYWENRWKNGQTGWKDYETEKCVFAKNMMDSMKALQLTEANTINNLKSENTNSATVTDVLHANKSPVDKTKKEKEKENKISVTKKNTCSEGTHFMSFEEMNDYVINSFAKINLRQASDKYPTVTPGECLHAFVPLCGDSSVISYFVDVFGKAAKISSPTYYNPKGIPRYYIDPFQEYDVVRNCDRPSVTGVDISMDALDNIRREQFPNRRFMPYFHINGHYTRKYCTLFRSTDGDVIINLFCGDIFDFAHFYNEVMNVGGYKDEPLCFHQFSVVYDRAAMIALDPTSRGPYVRKLVEGLISSHYSEEYNIGDIPTPFIFLELASREEGKRDPGPPYHIPIDTVMSAQHGYDPDEFVIELLDKDPSKEPWDKTRTDFDNPFIFYRTVIRRIQRHAGGGVYKYLIR